MKISQVIAAAGLAATLGVAPSFAQAPDNTNSEANQQQAYPGTFPSSDNDPAMSNQYMDESQRRWDATNRHLLAPESDRTYVYAPDPSHIHPGNSLSNPTGNELQGQNGGGK